ncbi:MAG: hypothetical protein ACC726_12585 [Chloroflexota bacterium]
MTAPKLDHETQAAISAEMVEAVYDAVRRMRLQRAGLLPPPTPSGRAWGLLARCSEPGAQRGSRW